MERVHRERRRTRHHDEWSLEVGVCDIRLLLVKSKGDVGKLFLVDVVEARNLYAPDLTVVRVGNASGKAYRRNANSRKTFRMCDLLSISFFAQSFSGSSITLIELCFL